MIIKKNLYKIIKETPLFKKGQKVWGYIEGYNYIMATGRYRGKGKWIRAHIRPYRNMNGSKNAKLIGEVILTGYLKKLFYCFEISERNHVDLKVKDLTFSGMRRFIKLNKRFEDIEREIYYTQTDIDNITEKLMTLKAYLCKIKDGILPEEIPNNIKLQESLTLRDWKKILKR